MFSPSLVCETSNFLIGSLPPTTMTSADFSVLKKIRTETSPGKANILVSIPATSTILAHSLLGFGLRQHVIPHPAS